MTTSPKPLEIAVIGGSGLYNLSSLLDIEEREVKTPYGLPSDKIRIGTLSNRRVAFLARHNRHHSLLPSEIPHKANIWALKSLGIKWLISLSAVGSLKEKYVPGHFVFPDQFVDRTKQVGNQTFFGGGIVAHVTFGHPVCDRLQTILFQSAQAMGAICHLGGTYLNMEGPSFSTKAESEMHRQLGFDVVGMTNLAEARLSREAEIAYASIAMITDYDCWHPNHDDVDVKDVVATLHKNAALAQDTIVYAISQMTANMESKYHRVLDTAIMTPRKHWPEAKVQELAPILARLK